MQQAFRAAGGVLSRGCRGRMHRNYANCGSVLARFGLHRPRKSLHDGAAVVLPRWRRKTAASRRGEEVPGTFTCVPSACTVCSADALDYLRFTPRRFEWIAHRTRRVVGCCERTVEPLSPWLMTERGRSPE